MVHNLLDQSCVCDCQKLTLECKTRLFTPNPVFPQTCEISSLLVWLSRGEHSPDKTVGRWGEGANEDRREEAKKVCILSVLSDPLLSAF